MRLRNLAKDSFRVERINLPVPNLGVFFGEDGRLWTERLEVTREEGGDVGAIRFTTGPPAEAGEAECVGEARAPRSVGVLKRALTALLG